jgi:hypothetical protein
VRIVIGATVGKPPPGDKVPTAGAKPGANVSVGTVVSPDRGAKVPFCAGDKVADDNGRDVNLGLGTGAMGPAKGADGSGPRDNVGKRVSLAPAGGRFEGAAVAFMVGAATGAVVVVVGGPTGAVVVVVGAPMGATVPGPTAAGALVSTALISGGGSSCR